ncbi:MAG: hypothetical protein AMJ81_03145 [Phycisphaerae bacterium SM23_33]|nr:MAG: hypothetical protein AMJ81_03145 [Phycisphaerae bacterium SM23_33]
MIVMAVFVSAGVAPAGETGQPPGPPGDWLPTEGKGTNWLQSTARCRELLPKLKLDDPLVRKCLPNIGDKVRMIRWAEGFDWRTIPAVEFLENMLADLIAGKLPNTRYAGKGIAFPYWSQAMQRIEAIWLHVPPSYDPAKEYQLFMCYKCGGGIHYKKDEDGVGRAHGGYRPSVEVANQTDTFFAWSSLSIQVKGRMNANIELMEAIPAMAREFSISPDRVFLTGYSDGGFTAIWLASRFPHLVAGIAPDCANWQYSNVNQVGLYDVPFLMVDGWYDGGYVQTNFARFHVLHTMGYPVEVIFGKHGHTYAPYENVTEFAQILDWAKTKRRNLWPTRVRYATWNLYWNRAFWLSIERMADPCLAAQIDAEVKDGNRIDVSTWNVGAYRLTLGGKLLDPAKPVTVLTNGKESYAGPFKAELLIEPVKPPEGRFVKGPASHGGISARINADTYGSKDSLKMPGRRWMWVKPTAADEETAKLLADWYPKDAKPDTDLTDQDIAERSLFLYGGPEINRFTARIAADLPVKFGKGSFTIGKKVYDQPTCCVAFIHPNPLSARKYVIVYAFNDAAAFMRHRFFGPMKQIASAWHFREGDCVVMGVPGRQKQWGAEVAAAAFQTEHHLFDVDWRPHGRQPLGELAARFDYAQILRLRADAMREAAGADLAIISSYTPSWRLWRSWLPAGAVTIHDLATVDMLPEYITVGEIEGGVLYRVDGRGRASGLLPGAAASTVLADKRDPSYEAKTSLALSDIDPKKTYRVAMGYAGLPTYGVNPAKMPDIYFFASPEEFAKSEHTSLPVRNMHQIPLEVNDAVAQYIQKHKKVSPRAACFDLTQYLMNPQANEFGAYDWLHVGANVSWVRPDNAPPLTCRYTVNLGLRAAGDPDLAPPRQNSKRFLDGDLAACGKPLGSQFASLAKKLPVAVAMAGEEFAIVAGEDGKSYRLAAPGAAAVGRAILVNIGLANAGEKDVVGLAALGRTSMSRINPCLWPGRKRDQDAPEPYYYGFRAYPRPPGHDNAALFLFDGKAPPISVIAERQAGYNFGLFALSRPVEVEAGAASSMPLLFIAVDKPPKGPDIDLPAVLEALKAELMKKLSASAGRGAG